jgi:hypothetical protein
MKYKKKIANHVQESFKKRKMAKELLDKAKQTIENYIESKIL